MRDWVEAFIAAALLVALTVWTAKCVLDIFYWP